MREAIGGTWLFGIVAVFIVLFSAFMAVSVNYSKTFKIKNGIVDLIERNQGFTNETKEQIRVYLNNMGYYVYGKCDVRPQGIDGQSEEGVEQSIQGGFGNRYRYCIIKTEGSNNWGSGSSGTDLKRTYYRVKVFFKMDLPIFGDILTFPITGETKAIYFAKN